MKTVPLLFRRIPWSQLLPLFALAFFSGGCDRSPEPETLQGYVEGEFLYIASPLSGALETLSVERGGEVVIGDPLFTLESGAETAARQLAKQRLAEGRARLEDAKKGSRPPEIAALEAQLHQRHDALTYSESELKRLMNLTGTGAISDQDVDRAKLLRDQDKQRVAQIEAELKTATLGSREDQITEAVANVGALEAALEKADWDLSQKRQIAPRAGRIFDVLYRPGDWVAAGKPVVALLPPDQIKVRAYLPEPRLGSIQPGDPVLLHIDGIEEVFSGKISFLSPQAEFTPPVIYSRQTRSKLVFLLEAVFPPETAVRLHPGQPVELTLLP